MSYYMDYNKWLEKELNNLERVRDIKHKALKSSDKRIKDLEEENKQLKQKINDLISKYPSRTKLTQLEEENEELKEDNEILIEFKNIWLDSHRLVTQERDKLKQELKEYRGF